MESTMEKENKFTRTIDIPESKSLNALQTKMSMATLTTCDYKEKN
jgi:hypothetical protein